MALFEFCDNGDDEDEVDGIVRRVTIPLDSYNFWH